MNNHCDNGAWVAGDWIAADKCADRFLCRGKPCAKLGPARKPVDGVYDVVIIGAGCVGASVARELSKTEASVLWLEGADDVSQGATKGNSGIVHAGFDDKPGSRRAQFCPTGCRMFPQLDEELHFGFQRNGSLVVAKGPEDEAMLEKLMEQGRTNGVKKLRIVGRDELLKMEPHLTKDVTAALHAGDAGTIVPYEFCIAVAENAVANGVDLRLRHCVTGLHRDGELMEVTAMSIPFGAKSWGGGGPFGMRPDIAARLFALFAMLAAIPAVYLVGGPASWILLATSLIAAAVAGSAFGNGRGKSSSSGKTYAFSPSKGTVIEGAATPVTFKARHVVNCAGCKSDEIAKLVGDDSFEVNARYGDYVLLHKKEGNQVGATIFPCPGPLGKGVLVQCTLWGNLILGPTARDTKKKDPTTGKLVPNDAILQESNASVMRYIFTKCRELVPGFNAGEVIHTFCGARAKTTRGDWIIEPCATEPRLIHAAGIDSPGLAGSPAIALEILRLLRAAGAARLDEPNPHFNPLRAPLVMPKSGLKDIEGTRLRMGPVGTVTDPRQNVVCKCEKVTEAEVIEACHRGIDITSTQAIRKRTRAGMGHCQGEKCNYDCESRVAAIIARETKTAEKIVGRRPWPASSLLPQRWVTTEEKAAVDALSR